MYLFSDKMILYVVSMSFFVIISKISSLYLWVNGCLPEPSFKTPGEILGIKKEGNCDKMYLFWTKFWQNCITLVDTWIQRWHPRARDQWEGLDCWSCLCKPAPEICYYESFMHTCTSVINLCLFQQWSFCGFECSMEASVTCVMTRTLWRKETDLQQ